MTTTAMTWDHLLNGSAASQASADLGDFKVFAVARETFQCGASIEVRLQRERGSWYVWRPDYSERFRSKKAALESCPALAAALAAQ